MTQDGSVLSITLARALRDAGLTWTPARGDSFVMPDRDMDGDIFVLSDMTIEVQQFPGGPVIGFNGTTEWALDDVELEEAIWLPREDQLRVLLGGTFRSLHRDGDGYRVEIELLGAPHTFAAEQPAVAYAYAMRHLLEAAGAAGDSSTLGQSHAG
jgi:hypothetical protein